MNVISGSSTSLRYTKQLYLNGYMRTNIKGRFQQILGNLPIGLATLATRRYLLNFLLMFEVRHSNIGSQYLRLMVAKVSLFQVAKLPTNR